jgi:site-specific recombinase XerD
MISEYCQWLRSRTSKHNRPFQEETITAYKVAARALDAWMTSEDIEEDFTGCDTAILNRFFRDYQAAHGQSGTNTKQRNLRHLFTWLEAEYDHPHPYTAQRGTQESPFAQVPVSFAGELRRHRCEYRLEDVTALLRDAA